MISNYESRSTVESLHPQFSHLPWVVALCIFVFVSGCKVMEETAKLPIKTVAAVMPGAQSAQSHPAALQADLLRYTDDFFSRTTSSLDDYALRAGTPQARTEALNWKAALNSSALGIATGPNPTANLVDFLALSSLTRAFVEQRAATAEPQGAFDVWLESSRLLETNAWKMAKDVLTSEQEAEFRDSIDLWLRQHSGSGGGFFTRPQELAAGIRQTGEKQSKPGSVFGLVGLDPMAGLDPAVREVTRARLFAERALFAMERMPFLLRWHTELTADDLFQREQLTNALGSAERLSRAVESASQTAAALPDRISAERKAIFDALELQEAKLRPLAAEVGRTLEAGEKMSTSLNTTLVTFDALMKRFGVGEPDPFPPQTNSRPFEILDYARTAEQIANMSQQLDALIRNASGTLDTPALDKRMEQLGVLSAKARSDAKSVLNHAFLLIAGLILLSFACALAYKRVTRQPAPPHSRGSAQEQPENLERTSA